MKYLSIDEVYFLHELAIKRIGGRSGVRDFTLLHSAVERSKATFGGNDLYPDIFSKAASLVHSLILNHPFEDGNKRAGFFALNGFLIKNKIKLKYSQNSALKFCLSIENKSLKFEGIILWLKKLVFQPLGLSRA